MGWQDEAIPNIHLIAYDKSLRQLRYQTVNCLQSDFLFANTMMYHNLPSDDKLRTAVLAHLASDDRISLANLRVGVLNGVVHLAGVVTSLEIWHAAADLAEAVPGIRGVVNRIEAPGAPSPSRTINLDVLHSGTHEDRT